uniref:Dipeptidyl peptidase 4 n=1 Tax=Astyanax mexicanus TaxID=7994 RepID=A0A8B9RD19_ASTMX
NNIVILKKNISEESVVNLFFHYYRTGFAIKNIRYSLTDNEYLHKSKDGNVYLHNVETMTNSLYLSNSTFAQVDATDYIVSADRKFVCFESNYSKLAFSFYYDFYYCCLPFSLLQAYVWDYNIFLKMNATAEPIQVTRDGKVNQILNGVPDWAYEEEVFVSNEGMWWSPTAKYLAYVQINDTSVQAIEYSLYGNGQYPSTMIVPYPKAGSNIPQARLFIVDVAKPSIRSEVLVPKNIGAGDHFLSSVTWVTDERIAVQWLTRRQDEVLLQIYDFDGANWKENLKFEQKSKTGWVGRVSVAQLTFYYVSNEHMARPGQRNLYKISFSSGGHSAPECVTCSLYQDRCQFNSAYFSRNASYFRMDCYGPGLPLFTLMDNRGTQIQVLEDNKKLEHILTTELLMPTIKRGTLKMEGFDFWYQMMFPPNFDASKKYPLLIQVYAGPASQYVDYKFKLEWATYLCSTENVIIASFDGRGSGYQGDRIMHAIYERLGTYEVEDQISAVRKFIDMGFIDKDRIGMWGWSYGGYVTSMALGSGSGLLKCGIAVAPVSKWEFYDAVYTERYMHRPEENSDSYKNSTVTGRAKNFKSVQYLLVHGTADDNVHFQQAAQISKALVEQQVDFDAMWYTDKDHGLSGKARYHLYTHLSHFLKKCFSEKK